MLTLITGAPGSGKTLWTMREVEKLRKESGRTVYYNGIPGVSLSGWQELQDNDAKAAHSLPEGSIVVIDEVYRLWPQGRAGEQLPQDVELFATHRHRGHDFYLLVQDRQRLHHFIRGLVGRHIHVERQFGIERARLFEWQRLGDPKDKWDKQSAMGAEFIYPKEVYGWYKSAELHTVKKRLPWRRLMMIPGLIAIAAISLMTAMSQFSMPATDRLADEQEAAPVEQTAEQPFDARTQGDSWAQQWQERVPGQPHSARFYDVALKAATFPKISGCMELRSERFYKCACNTQQGTTITTMSVADCKFYLVNGWFDPSKGDDRQDGRASSSQVADIASPGWADSGAAAQPAPFN